jgi:hypothetical protein
VTANPATNKLKHIYLGLKIFIFSLYFNIWFKNELLINWELMLLYAMSPIFVDSRGTNLKKNCCARQSSQDLLQTNSRTQKNES